MTPEDEVRYVQDRPGDAIRVSNPWRPFAHYIAELDGTIRRLVEELQIPNGGRVLDYGCADAPYHRFFGPGVDIVAADLPGNPLATTTLLPDGSVREADASFDAVLSTQVLEHVADPDHYLAECHRVLRPGGQLLLSTHGIFYYHPDPVDYWRWTGEGLERVVERAGFSVVSREGVFGTGAMGLQLVLDTALPRVPERLRPLAIRAAHSLIRFVDVRQSAEHKRYNASVFALVASKPS